MRHQQVIQMPRMNVYVSDELKARMDAANPDDYNWSALAAQAFATALDKADTKKMVVARLLSGKSNSVKWTGGYKVGLLWASHLATLDDFLRVERAGTINRMWWADVLGTFPDSQEAQVLDDFIAGHVTDHGVTLPVVTDEVFLRGFGAGVSEIWEDVKDEVKPDDEVPF